MTSSGEPHRVDRRCHSRIPVLSGQKHGMKWGGVQHGNQTSGCWQGQHQGRALCSRQNPPLQPSSRGSSCWCYLGTKVGATLEVSGHLSLCLGANYVLTFFLNCPLLRVTQDTPLSTRGPLASTQKESGVGFESVNQAHM